MTPVASSAFNLIDLDDNNYIMAGTLPTELLWDERDFDQRWGEHPFDLHELVMYGRPVKTPRWQQAYGADYAYTGSRNNALPIPNWLLPLQSWAASAICDQLNGFLLNWYEGPEHYIGPHHDSLKG